MGYDISRDTESCLEVKSKHGVKPVRLNGP